jgi:hypothetical protein
MTTQRNPETILAVWLDEGPTDLPDATRRAILSALPTTPQERGLRIPWRTPAMSTPLRLAAAIAIVAIVGAAGLALINRTPITGPGGSPVPTPSATPIAGAASDFPHPFTYELPADAGIVVSVAEPSWYQFRVPNEPGASTAYGNSVVIRLISGGRTDPCAATSEPLPLPDGPEAVVDYLTGIPSLDVSAEESTTVDGRPARQVVITSLSPTADCPDLWLWTEQGSFTQNSGWGSSSRLTVVDVEGDHIVILATADPAWYPVADALIDSIQFDAAPD